MLWTDLIKYPLCKHDLVACALMDTMQEIIPIVDKGNRIDTMLSWLRVCKREGIITLTEHMNIQQELIHGCGGF